MKKNNSFFLHMGLPSLTVIFIVLCLAVFSTLSYVSACRDYSLSFRTAERIGLYYEADLALRKELIPLNDQLLKLYQALPQKEESLFFQKCEETIPGVSDGVLTLQKPYGESQALLAELSLNLPQEDGDSFYRILKWQVIHTGEWTPDDSLPVLQAP